MFNLISLILGGSSSLTCTDRRIMSLPLAMLETFSTEGPMFLTSEPNHVSAVTIIRYFRQVFAHINITFERYYR